jgi:hypothetical protein
MTPFISPYLIIKQGRKAPHQLVDFRGVTRHLWPGRTHMTTKLVFRAREYLRVTPEKI